MSDFIEGVSEIRAGPSFIFPLSCPGSYSFNLNLSGGGDVGSEPKGVKLVEDWSTSYTLLKSSPCTPDDVPVRPKPIRGQPGCTPFSVDPCSGETSDSEMDFRPSAVERRGLHNEGIGFNPDRLTIPDTPPELSAINFRTVNSTELTRGSRVNLTSIATRKRVMTRGGRVGTLIQRKLPVKKWIPYSET